MAQQGSFLYSLKLELDSEGAASQLQSKMQDISASITDVGERANVVERQIKRALSFEDFDFDTPLRGFNQIEQSAVEGFSRAQEQLHGLADRMNRDLEEMVQNAGRLETASGQAFSQLRDSGPTQTAAQRRFRQQTPSVGGDVAQTLRNDLLKVKQEFKSLEGRGSASIKQLASDFSGLGTDVSGLRQDLSTLMSNLEATGQSMRDLATENPFDHIEQGARRVPRAINEVRQEVLQSESALKDLAASADRSWGRITNGALEAAQGAERMSASIVQSAERAEQGLRGMQNQMVRSRGATYSLGSSASSAASQLSVDLTQSAQDAAFGIENLAASVPFLSEQFGRVRRETGSFTGALADIGSALMGPTGVIAGVTLLLTYKDSIISFFSDIEGHVNSAVEAVEDFAKGVTDAGEAAQRAGDDLTSFLDIEDVSLFKQLRKLPEEEAGQFFNELGQKASQAGNKLKNARQEFNRIAEQANEHQVSMVPSAENVSQLRTYINTGRGRVQQLAKQRLIMRQQRQRIKQINRLMQARNAESLKLEQRAEKIAENSKFNAEFVERILRAQKETNEEKEEGNKKDEKRLEYQERLAQLQVEKMPEGLNKQIAKIEASIAARREEIKALNLQEKKQQELLDLLDKVAERKKEQAFEDSVTLPEPEEGGGMPLMIRNPTDTGPAFVPLEDATEQVKKAQKKMNERLDRERQRLRDERSFGATMGALEELGSMQIQFQLDMMEKEENLRLTRLKKQRDFIRTRADIQEMLGNQGAADRLNEQANQINKEIASVERKWQRKRLQQQQEFLGKQIRNIETTPLGEAYKGLFLDVGSVLQSFYSKSLNWQKKNMAEKASVIGQAGTKVVGAAENIATQRFNSWLSVRRQELKSEGKSQKERTKILKKEGKKRFQFMKAMKIAEASMAGLTGAINAYVAGTNLAKAGVPAPIPHIVGLSLAGASLAATGAKISKIAGMSIGDKLSGAGGGGGGGAGAPGGKFTQRAAASSATMASKVGTDMQAQRKNDEDKINKTAERVGNEVGKQMPDKVTMDRDTAESAKEAANKQQTKLNK
jgi:hypothetical protein